MVTRPAQTTRYSRQARELSPERLKRIHVATLRGRQAWPARCRGCRYGRPSVWGRGRYMRENAISVRIWVADYGSDSMWTISRQGRHTYSVARRNEGRRHAQGEAWTKNDLDIPVALTSVAGGGIAVCGCAPVCLLGLFSSWQRWPISRLMLTRCVSKTRVYRALSRGPRKTAGRTKV